MKPRDRLPMMVPTPAECPGTAREHGQAPWPRPNSALPSRQSTPKADTENHFLSCYQYLEKSGRHYSAASRHILVDIAKQVHRIATLHWVVVQKLSVEVALGKVPSDEYWRWARFLRTLPEPSRGG